MQGSRKSCGYARAVSQDLGHQERTESGQQCSTDVSSQCWPEVNGTGDPKACTAEVCKAKIGVSSERTRSLSGKQYRTNRKRSPLVGHRAQKKEHIKHDGPQNGESITKKVEGFV